MLSKTRTIIRVIDLETGPEPIDGQPGIIEYGHTDVWTDQYDLLGNPFNWQVGKWTTDQLETYVKPHAAVPPETSAIHNIIDEDLEHAPDWAEVSPYITFADRPGKTIVALAAHNIECEKSLIGDGAGGLPWICTYKVALRLWPDSPSHSNNAVRYFLNPDGLDRRKAVPTHRALPDSYVTAFTLREALNAGHSMETLIKWTNEFALLARCRIGERYRNGGKGTPWSEVDSGMLSWILGKDFDEDTKHTARFHLEQRELDQRNEWERHELNAQYRANGMPETESFDAPRSPSQSTNSDAPQRDPNTLELKL